MYLEEHAAKGCLERVGIAVPRGQIATTAERAYELARELGAVLIKAQVPTGGRWKAGGIEPAATPEQAMTAARRLLGRQIAGHRVERVLVEERCPIAHEYYAAVLNDASSATPRLLFSPAGGVDIEQVDPKSMQSIELDIRAELDPDRVRGLLDGCGVDASGMAALVRLLPRLYRAYRRFDAELLEVNPLAATVGGGLIALDCKLVVDDSALPRQSELAQAGAPERSTPLEARGRAAGLRYIELDGDIGVLANGAGLGMATMDAVQNHGGRPANFIDIGGSAYTLARPALELVLAHPQIRSLVVNFCGAFARTDVMVDGVISAWRALDPVIPAFFSVHGTGETEAIAMLRDALEVEPYDTMEQAVLAAIAAARGRR